MISKWTLNCRRSPQRHCLDEVLTTHEARLDVAASGFWGGRCEQTLVDVRIIIFNSLALSNSYTILGRCFMKHEPEKI